MLLQRRIWHFQLVLKQNILKNILQHDYSLMGIKFLHFGFLKLSKRILASTLGYYFKLIQIFYLFSLENSRNSNFHYQITHLNIKNRLQLSKNNKVWLEQLEQSFSIQQNTKLKEKSKKRNHNRQRKKNKQQIPVFTLIKRIYKRHWLCEWAILLNPDPRKKHFRKCRKQGFLVFYINDF